MTFSFKNQLNGYKALARTYIGKPVIMHQKTANIIVIVIDK